MALHCIVLHYIALHYIVLRCIALHCVTEDAAGVEEHHLHPGRAVAEVARECAERVPGTFHSIA